MVAKVCERDVLPRGHSSGDTSHNTLSRRCQGGRARRPKPSEHYGITNMREYGRMRVPEKATSSILCLPEKSVAEQMNVRSYRRDLGRAPFAEWIGSRRNLSSGRAPASLTRRSSCLELQRRRSSRSCHLPFKQHQSVTYITTCRPLPICTIFDTC